MLGTYALASGYYDAYYVKAQKVRTLIKRDYDEAFKHVDVILAPTSPTVAFKIGARTDDPLQMYLSDIFTIPANMAGLPGIAIPCGFSEGLPVSLQVLGGAFGEVNVLRAAHAYEQATQLADDAGDRCRAGRNVSAVARTDPRQFFERHRSRIAILFVLIVVTWFLLAFAEQAWRARQLQAEASLQRAAIASIEADNTELREQLAVYETDAWLDYAQSRARRDLNLANPGETVLMVRWGPRQPGEASEQPATSTDAEPANWRKWVDVFTPE